jgi:hypothetical protein
MAQIYRGIAVVKGTQPHRFTIVAIYRNDFTGIETTSHLLAKPLAESEMRKHLLRTGLDRNAVDAAIAGAHETEVPPL